MNEHDELEPTVAMPRVTVTPASTTPPPAAPAPPAARDRPAANAGPAAAYRPVTPPGPVGPVPPAISYVFGNPVNYALRRFAAFAVDAVIVTVVATMLLYGLIAINPFTGLPNNSEGGFDATVAMGVAIAFIYIWLFESIFGVTLGKLAFALHVYVPRRRFVGFGRAFIRNLLRPIDLLVIGAILAMAPGHRRLGDLLGGTLVAQSPLRAFAPLIGWIGLIALAAVPFLVAGGTVTVLAVATAFVEFVPPLLARGVHAVAGLFGATAAHLPGAGG